MKLYTDYPIIELGDEVGKRAPIRECELVENLNNKWVKIKVQGVLAETKRFYVYKKRGRYGDVPHLEICDLPT